MQYGLLASFLLPGSFLSQAMKLKLAALVLWRDTINLCVFKHAKTWNTLVSQNNQDKQVSRLNRLEHAHTHQHVMLCCLMQEMCTPLWVAACQDNVAVMTLLLDAGSNPNAADQVSLLLFVISALLMCEREKCGPMHTCSSRTHTKCIIRLVSLGFCCHLGWQHKWVVWILKVIGWFFVWKRASWKDTKRAINWE